MTGLPPSITAAAEFEVPRSIPMTRPMIVLLCQILLSRAATVLRGIRATVLRSAARRAALPLMCRLEYPS